MDSVGTANKRLVKRLVLVVGGMFFFAVFAMPPIYNVFCEITGLNGKVSQSDGISRVVDDSSRVIGIEFLTDVDAGLPWSFSSERSHIEVKPGGINVAHFSVKNLDDQDLVGRAIPSVSPAEAAKYVKKTQCFCFENKLLKAHVAEAFPVVFYIDPSIPKHIKTVTLSYRFYRQG